MGRFSLDTVPIFALNREVRERWNRALSGLIPASPASGDADRQGLAA